MAYSNWASLERAMQKAMKAAMRETRDMTEIDADVNVAGYYTGSPKIYERTETLLSAAKTSSISGNGNMLEFETKMDDSISYNTGTFDGFGVLVATEYGVAGVVGTPGYWAKTEADIQENIRTAFGKQFN